MEFIALSPTLSMSRIAMGFWRLMDWKMSTSDLEKFVDQVLDLGVTTFDHADIYGEYQCEKAFGQLLLKKPGLRKQIQLVSKCGIKLISDKFPGLSINQYDTSYNHIIKSVENSLNNLNTDYLDLLLIHRPDPLMDPAEIAMAFKELEKSGKVLNFGVSNFNPLQFEGLNNFFDGKLVTNQVEISPLNLEHFDNGNMDFFMNNQLHPMGWSPLAQGMIFTPNNEKAIRVSVKLNEIANKLNVEIDQLVYAWILFHPAKVIPIVGSGKIERLQQAINAFDVNLTREQWYEIYNASRGHSLP